MERMRTRWLGATTALGVTAALAAVVATTEAASAASGLTLLRRHAPIVVMHPDDPFVPVPVDGYLADSDVTAQAPDGTWVVQPGPLPAGGAGLRLDQRLCQAKEGPQALDCYARAEATHGATPTVYGAIFRAKGRTALQYWLFYPYDVWSQTGPKGTVWRAHEGDWEVVSVLLDARERPMLLSLSQHCGGIRRAWARVTRSGTHPVVHAALGSHANEPGAGVTRQSVACWPPIAKPVLEALGIVPRDVAADGRRVRPVVIPVTASSPSWMRYAGSWGEAQYAGFPGNDPIAFGAGPVGPAFHSIWRRPFAEPLAYPTG